MSFVFKKASREQVGLLIGYAGGTGSGKTFSALRTASGLAGGKPFALIDTEAGRAKHYADQFAFDHGDLKPPFRPDAYVEAIKAADSAGYPVIVVDSMSHVWAGDGGVLDWQEEELDRMAKGDWQKREACKFAAWIAPKMSHKHMVQKLLQVRAHLILCFRAEEKIEIIKEGGKTKVVPKQGPTGLDGWMPVCEKNLPFELTASFLLRADAPGLPMPIKLQQQHRPFFPADRPISEESGRQLAEWAAGGTPRSPLDRGGDAARSGSSALLEWWNSLTKPQKAEMKLQMDALKAAAAEADARQATQAPPPAAALPPEPVAPPASAHAAGKAPAVTQAILMDRLRGCSTVEGVKRVEADAESLPADQRAELLAECAKHADFL